MTSAKKKEKVFFRGRADDYTLQKSGFCNNVHGSIVKNRNVRQESKGGQF